MRGKKTSITHNEEMPEVSEEEFQVSLRFFARVACTRAELFKTCNRGKCRRFKACMGRESSESPERYRFENLPPCALNSKENHEAMRLQVPLVEAEMMAMTPVDGMIYLTLKPPKPHRSRQ